MAKVLKCRDTGIDCAWVGHAETEDEVLQAGAEHAKTVHGEEITPELMDLARSLIRDE